MSNINNDESESSGSSSLTTNRWLWAAAAALVLAAVIGLVFMLVFPGHKGSAAAKPSAGKSAAGGQQPTHASPAPSGWSDLGCNGTRGSTAVPVQTPKVTWQPLKQWSVPVSSTLGPKQTTGPLRHCYQHTPSGAIIAAGNSPFTVSAASPAQFKTVVDELITPGPERNQVIKGGPGTGGHALDISITAWRVDSCSPERCNLSMLVEANGHYIEQAVPMVWVDGDWKTDGSANEPGRLVPSIPAGFITYRAGS